MLRFAISLLSFLPIHPASQVPDHELEKATQDYEARIIGCRRTIQTSARQAKKHEVALLLTNAKTARDPLQRVVSGYALYRLDPKTHLDTFLGAFVESKGSPLYLTFLDAFNEENKAPTFPGDNRPFSYWSVVNALIELSKHGNVRALRIWLTWAGGDGEYGEGKSEDVSDFLFTSPHMVISNWRLLRRYSHEFFTWGAKPDRIDKMRKQYLTILPKNHPSRAEILKMIDRLEAEAKTEWGDSNPDSEVVKP